MSDSRTRRPSASTSASTPKAGVRLRLADRSPRSGSGTPIFEDDDEGHPKRSTRGRNPLPPTSGPLFPPLPPKLHKSRISGTSLNSTLDAPMETGSPSPSDKPDVPTTSNASLTPPPPGSEDVLLDEEEEAEGDEDATGRLESPSREDVSAEEIAGAGDSRGRNTPAQPNPDESRIKTEIGLEERDTRTGSERAASQSRAKRRRGEEALLLDDHLLPPDVRRISQSTSRRGSKNVNRDDLKVPPPPDNPPAKDIEMAKPEVVEGEDEVDPMEEEGAAEDDEEADEWDGPDITRCVCTNDEAETALMIQCDKCNVWQHGPCMGIWEDDEAPDEYFCEKCRPDLHVPLRRYLRKIGRAALGGGFVPPSYQELKVLRPYNEVNHPSQSTVWLDPSFLKTPTPPPKAASRSHHKKEVDPVAESSDGRRSGRRLPFPERPAVKPLAKGKSRDQEKDKDKDKVKEAERDKEEKSHAKQSHLPKRRSSAGHRESTSPNRSLSPSAHMHSAARRRITMNSRDSMYEEEVKAAMEASRREALGLSPMPKSAPEEIMEDDEADKQEVKKGKRKRDREDHDPSSADHGPHSNKAKHPNQYTYRPKPPSSSTQPVSAASPARRGAGTPAPPPSLPPPQHEHGTRRAGAIANGAITNPNLTASSVASLNWYIPEHLVAYSDLLPTPQPVALDIRSQRVLPYQSRNHHHNQRYGPFSEERDEEGRLVLPEEIPMREPADEADTHLEPPARVKYPAKRITVGEIRKRVRGMLDYIAKVQSTEDKRLERNKALGVVVTPLPRKVKAKSPVESNEEPDMEGGAANGHVQDDGDIEMGQADDEANPDHDTVPNPLAEGDGPPEPAETTRPAPAPRSSTELMEELTRELLAFQETFIAPNGYSSPMPPPVPSFDMPLAIPDTPAIPEAETEPETPAPREPEIPSSVLTEVDADALEYSQEHTPEPTTEKDLADGFTTPDQPISSAAGIPTVEEMLNFPGTPAETPLGDNSGPNGQNALLGHILSPVDPVRNEDLVETIQADADEAVIEPTREGLDVYREGQVDKVVISGEEERDVVDHSASEVQEQVQGSELEQVAPLAEAEEKLEDKEADQKTLNGDEGFTWEEVVSKFSEE